MQSDLLQPACITLRYGDKKYLLCADEVTEFMKNCERMGLSNVLAIVNQVNRISESIKTGKPMTEPERSLSLKLLDEIAESTRSCIFEDK